MLPDCHDLYDTLVILSSARERRILARLLMRTSIRSKISNAIQLVLFHLDKSLSDNLDGADENLQAQRGTVSPVFRHVLLVQVEEQLRDSILAKNAPRVRHLKNELNNGRSERYFLGKSTLRTPVNNLN